MDKLICKNLVVPKCNSIRLTPEAQKYIDKLKNDFCAKILDDLHTRDFLNAVALKEILKLMNQLKKVLPFPRSIQSF
ncbi:hypothetical protein MKX01_022717 [Papaver californicum]|nr:hypothetical protein MKX01_022717 [Papaver californicum]